MADGLFGPTITHDHLQELAQRLLKGKSRQFQIDEDGDVSHHYLGGCHLVASEMINSGEQADAIGWSSGGWSTLIECKASRADFLRDAEKFYRRHEDMGMGLERYYLTAPGVIREDDDLDGWGHIEAPHPTHLSKLVFRKPSKAFECHRRHELAALIQAVRMAGSMVDHQIGRAFVYLQPYDNDGVREPELAEMHDSN